MAAYDPVTHKDLVASTGNLKDALPVDARAKLARLMENMGLLQIIAANVNPSDRDVLWWHIDAKTMKRYNAVLGNWYPATGNQLAMHIFRRAILGSGSEQVLENADLFLFWDTSLGEVKKISRADLITALGELRSVATTEGIKGGGTLAANRTLSLDVPGLTERADTPMMDDYVIVYDPVAAAHRKTSVRKLVQSNAGLNFFYGQ